MTITVTTGGPTEVQSTIIDTSDPTFSDMMEAIADDIDDTTGEYFAQIQSAIVGAIRYCEREPYYFNETRDETFVTVNGQEWYDADDNAKIPTLVRIVAVYSEDASSQRTELRRYTPEEIELLTDNSAATGEPYAYTYFGQRIRLYPIPSATVYTIRLQLGPYRLAKIASTEDTNAWITEAFDMIKARSKYTIYKDILKDATLAVEALNDYEDQHRQLTAETSRRNGRGFIKITCF
jgi:hypothetical protein